MIKRQRVNSSCPICRDSRGAASPRDLGEEDRPARKGDALVCLNCATLLIIDRDDARVDEDGVPVVHVREMTTDEVGNLPDHTRIALMRVRKRLNESKPVPDNIKCPVCDAELMRATHMMGRSESRPAGPKPGDLGQCGGCCAPLVFGENKVRLMTRAEWERTPAHLQSIMMRNLVRQLHEVLPDCLDDFHNEST